MTGRHVGCIAVITGASRGIGAAVAQRFAAEGARVILIGRTLDDLEAVGNLIRANVEDNGVAALVRLAEGNNGVGHGPLGTR